MPDDVALEGEILPPSAAGVSIVACPHPFEVRRVEMEVPSGLSLAEMVALVQPHEPLRRFCHVSIGDMAIDPRYLSRIRPREGARVTIRMLPAKSEGGGGGKNPLKTVLTIAMIVASIAVPVLMAPMLAGLGTVGAALATGLIVGGINMVGGMMINALAPPAKPKLSALSSPTVSQDRDSPTLSLTGARNTVRPGSPVAVVLGSHWQVPALGAPTYTEVVGSDQYLRMCVVWGIGPLHVTTRKVGDTPLEHFQGVETEFRRGYQPSQITDRGVWHETGTFPPAARFGDHWTIPFECVIAQRFLPAGSTITYNGLVPSEDPNGWDLDQLKPFTLFPWDVVEEPYQIELTHDAWNTRTTAQATDHISVDFVYYRGLVQFGDLGEPQFVAAQVVVEYAPTGTGAFVLAAVVDSAANTTSAHRRGFAWNVPRGQYDVRLRRNEPTSTNTRQINDVAWTAMRSFQFEPPFRHHGTPGPNPISVCAEVIRIRASEQLQGVIEDLSGLCHCIALDWNGSEWKHAITSNPASLFRLVYEGPGNPVPLPASRIDLEMLQYWWQFCVDRGFSFRHIVDYPSTVEQIATDIAASSMASVTVRDNKQSIVVDDLRTVPVQVFTPRNSWGFSSEIQYPQLPHGYRIRFIDPLTGKGLERVVYDDGYDASNAHVFETLELTGVTDAAHAWVVGRYQIAAARLRRETVSFSADFEAIVCTRGDLIRFSHDVPLWGIKAGRVMEVIEESGSITGVRIDEPVPMSESKSYTIRFRRASPANREQYAAVVLSPREDNHIVSFSALPATVDGIPTVSAGDIFWFGETGREHRNLRVHAIVDPTPDFAMRVICVEDNPAIYTSAYGGIPPYDPGITTPVSVLWPRVLSIRSDGTVVIRSPDGRYVNRILITYALPSGSMISQLSGVEARFRRAGTQWWITWPITIVQTGEVSLTLVDGGVNYEIQLRFARRDGSRGMWSPSEFHTVIAADGAPPDVPYFVVTRMADGTRRFEWRMVLEPADVVAGGGYRIKYVSGGDFNWSTASPMLTTGLLQSSPYETNEFASGVWTFGIKAVTASGIESTTARTIVVELGSPRERDVLLLQHEHLISWPGTRGDCGLRGSPPYYLFAGPGPGSLWSAQGAWDTMQRWIDLPRVTPIYYITQTIDPANGRDLTFTPRIEVDADGDVTAEMRVRTAAQGATFGADPWGPIAQVSGAAYLQVKITADGPRINRLIITIDGNVAVDDIEDINTLTSTAVFFQRLGTGHFRVACRKAIAAITGAAVRAIQSNGTSWTWQLVSKNATVAGNSNPAAEFKIYLGGVATDAIVDVELKGPLM